MPLLVAVAEGAVVVVVIEVVGAHVTVWGFLTTTVTDSACSEASANCETEAGFALEVPSST